MQRTALYILLIITLGFAGCKKYLEKAPDSTWTQLDTPEKISQLLGTAYPQGNYMTFCEAISDNVEDKGKGEDQRVNRDPFFFNDVQANEEDSPEQYWRACYTAIAVANNALKACESAIDSAAYSRQKGEALVARAYAHFMLVNFFSKSYDSTTAATDPGIPYVTEPEDVVMKQYERKTVAYVYEQIEKDLLAGLPLIRDDKYKVPRYHFNPAAAYAFATRFYLFKKHYAKVVAYAAMVFPANNLADNMRPWNTEYMRMTPAALWNIYSNSSEKANLLLVETPSTFGRYLATYRFGMTYAIYRDVLYENATGGSWAYPVYSYGEQNYFVPKITEYFVKSSVNASIGTAYVMVPLFTTEEVLFNRAEANTYLNKTTEVLQDLNLYASKRIANYDATTNLLTLSGIKAYNGIADTKKTLVKTILDFKRAEYIQEGMRWFDMMRYKMPVTHVTSKGETITLGADDPRRVFQIPASTKTSGLELNPR
ncbi:SusD family protein [Chitinophaga sp. CF118]|uniref:RagB/SusD family nutrient uptake outer membrane protein n=1 Tax=Chitinophaga sp. CF118 TaxID=1884367 RepID=UPI0008EE0410|nr:RagB/SusD family nutrient uptake outer membrane protein [Chitinophaga sp. CF118]SFE97014.1 SusD family protein [Chitinophaga sp. CF118]